MPLASAVRAVHLAGMAVILAACTSIGIPAGRGSEGTGPPASNPPRVPASGLPERPTASARSAAIAGYRIVAAKEPPATLIAQGGRRCAVDAARYQRTTPGDEVFCVWMEDEPQ